jgi:hypothetical protein
MPEDVDSEVEEEADVGIDLSNSQFDEGGEGGGGVGDGSDAESILALLRRTPAGRGFRWEVAWKDDGDGNAREPTWYTASDLIKIKGMTAKYRRKLIRSCAVLNKAKPSSYGVVSDSEGSEEDA